MDEGVGSGGKNCSENQNLSDCDAENKIFVIGRIHACLLRLRLEGR